MVEAGGKTILLVEDEAIIALEEQKVLERYGYAVVVVASGEEAVERVAAGPDIDLILMDIKLGPGMDGTEAAQRILAHRDLPLIFLSSYAEREIVEKTEGITSYGCIVKRAGETVLIALVKMAFRLHSARLAERVKERALRESEAKYRSLVETTGTGFVIIDAEGVVLDCNAEYLRLTGRSGVDEVVGRKVVEWTAPADQERNAAAVAACAAAGQIRNFVVEYLWPSGERVPVEINATLIEEGGRARILTVCRDISDRKGAEDALRREKGFLDAIFDSVPGMLYLYDGEGHLVRWNKKHELMTGYSSAELRGMSLLDWYKDDPESQAAVTEGVERTMATGFGDAEAQLQRKDGSRLPMYFTAVPLEIEGKPYFTGLGIDITERKRAADELKALLAEKEWLLKETHHRIKNNMGVIAGLLNLQASEQGEGACAEILRGAANQAQGMMLLYDKLYRAGSRYELGVGDYLRPLVEQLVGILSPRSSPRIEFDLENFILCERTLSPLGIILNELVTNSLKHAFADGDERVIGLRSRTLGGGRASVEYWDRGRGLQAAEAPTTGFGLQLVDLLVEQIRGTLAVDGTGGAKYSIEFPLDPTPTA